MSDLGKKFNLKDLEKMSEEGLDHFNNKEALSDIESEMMSKVNARLDQSDSSMKYLKPLGILAIVASLAILLFVLFGNNTTSQQLYASNYNTPQFLLSSTERTSDAEVEPIFSIKNLYAQGKYSECLKTMESNNSNVFSQYPDLKLYQGICQLEEGNPKEAIRFLSQSSIALEDVRLWYLALAQLKSDQKEASIKSLELLLKVSSTYKNAAAKKLLATLKAE